MPVIRRREQQRREDLETLSNEQRRHLTYGSYFFERPFRDRETFEEAWGIHGERLTEDWIAEHPGTRPFGWWLVDHRCERPVVANWATPSEVQHIRARGRWDKFGFLHTELYGGPRMTALQEDETEYLRRNGLLRPDEEAAIAEQENN